jgi:plasmid stabilization system protein ParE
VKRTLIVRPPAEADFESAFRWYQEQNLGLGAEFIRAVDAVLASIVREPEAYPVVYRQSRRALLRRFPYAVYFLRMQSRWRSRLAFTSDATRGACVRACSASERIVAADAGPE